MRRRRKSKFTWMPMLGSRFAQEGAAGYNPNFLWVENLKAQQELAEPPDLTQGLIVLPLVPDFTVLQTDQVGEQFTLRDLTEGQDWLCKRIVGKFHLQVTANAWTVDDWPQFLVTAGIFVARSQDESQADVDLSAAECDPQAVDNIRQPWAWRRTWLLANQQSIGEAGGAPVGAPGNTMQYGSVLDGPHIDMKVSRRIRREERLWLAISMIGHSDAATAVSNNTNGKLDGVIDLRILGAMRRSNNRSTF